jgi:hypothetical protein
MHDQCRLFTHDKKILGSCNRYSKGKKRQKYRLEQEELDEGDSLVQRNAEGKGES